jgi:hypothetical protein
LRRLKPIKTKNNAIKIKYPTVDAEAIKRMVEQYGRRCLLIEGDLRQPTFSSEVVRRTLEVYGRLDVLIGVG